MSKLILLVSLFCLPLLGFSQATGDYRSHATGTWASTSSWERYNGSTWITPAPTVPVSADGVITIQSPHVITVAVTNTSIDQLTVSAGATLVVNSGITFNINNGSGATDVTIAGTITNNGTVALPNGSGLNLAGVAVNGTFNNSGTVTFGNTSSRLNFNLGSNYYHTNTTTPGAIPAGGSVQNVTWNVNSTVHITGYTTNSTPPTGLNQAFGTFIWDTQNLNLGGGGVFDLNGQLTTVNGGLTINSVGPNGDILYLSQATPYTLNVLLDVNINSGLIGFTDSGDATLTFHQGFFNHADNLVIATGSANVTMTVSQSFFLLGTDFDFNSGSGTVTLNASGDVAFNSSSTVNSSGTTNLNFVGTTQNFFSNVIVVGSINYYVSTPTTLTIGGVLSGSGTLTVGAGSQTADGAIIVTSADAAGAIQSNTTNGSIQVGGTRTYNTGSSIIYGAGTVAMGSGQPTAAGVNTIVNNGSGLNLTANVTIGGDLTLTSGNLSILGRTLTLNGAFTPGANTLVTSTTSNISIGGSGAFGNLAISGSTTIASFTINRGSTGSVTLITDLKVTGTLTQTLGDISLNGHMLTISGPYSYGAGSFVGTSSSNLIIDGSGAVGTIGIGGGVLNTLEINRTGATVTCNNVFTVMNLNLWAGTFNNVGTITMAAGGAIISRDAGFLSSPIGAATTYDVIYLNSSASPESTGPELPTSASLLNNLTVASVGQINLSQNVTVNGTTTFSNGVFNAGTFTVDIKGNLVSNNASLLTSSLVTFSGTTTISGTTGVTFGSVTVTGTVTPTSNLNINGNLINNGTLNSGSATVTFGGSTTISGSSVSSFNNVIIASSSTLTGPANFNVSGAWTNNGTFTHGAASNTVTFTGTSAIGGSAVSPASDFSGIIINASSTLTAPTSLVMSGAFQDNGTFNAGTGTVVFNGAVVQNLTGSSNTVFNNISTSNPSSVVFGTAKSVKGAITILPGAGSGTINANGKLTLISNASGDGYIAQITNGSITGNMTVQRFLPENSAAKAYRYLASPVTNATVADWKSDFPITGTFSDPSTAAEWPSVTGMVQANPSLFVYNEAHTPTSSVNDRYEGYPSAGVSSGSATLVSGKGYAAYVRFASAITTDLTGTPRQGAWPVSVTNQSGSISGNDGWNLIGNPYAAPINWDNVTVPGGVSTQIAMKDNLDNIGLGAGQYIYYIKGSPGTGIPSTYHGTLASGQAFNVRAVSNSTITFQESNKQAVTSPIFIRSDETVNIARIHISGNNLNDELVMDFSDSGSDKAEITDGYKLTNDYINLYSLSSDGIKMAINAMGPVNCSKEVAVGVDNITPGTYTFSFGQMETFGSNLDIRMVDSFAGTSTLIESNATTYTFAVTSDVASYGSKRFKMTFTTTGLPTQLAFIKSPVCSGSDAAVSLDNTTAGISYTLTLNGNQAGASLNGNGGLLTFPVSKDLLSAGVNHFSMTAYTATCNAGYVQKDSIIVEGIYAPKELSSTTACQPGTVTITAQGAPTGGFYNWYLRSTDTTPIADQTSGTLVVPFLAKTTTYYVAVVNKLGCEGDRVAVTAPVVNFENAAITQTDEITLTSNFAKGNTWFLDGTQLADTTATLKIKASGTYTLQVHIGTCITSAETILLVTGLEGTSANFKGYPNPMYAGHSVYSVELSDPTNSLPSQLPIYNTLGSQVGTIPLTTESGVKKGQYDFASHSSGIYFVRVLSGNNITVLKVIKN